MVSETLLAAQCSRLFSLPFAPSAKEDRHVMLHEFIRVLRDHVNSGEHLKAIVDHLINTAHRCPPAAEVFEAALSVQAPKKTKAPLGCEKCQGSGYVSFTKRVHIAGMDPYDADFSKPCDCALGQFIQPEYDKRKNRAPGSAEELR